MNLLIVSIKFTNLQTVINSLFFIYDYFIKFLEDILKYNIGVMDKECS